MPAPSFGRHFVLPLVLLIGGLAVAALLLRSAPDALDNPAYAAIVAAHSRKLAAQAASLDSARTALEAAQARVPSTIHELRTLRDTLNVHDTVQVKVFVARADSVVRACTELSETCAMFRTRAESSMAGLTVDRDLWKGIAQSQQPSRWAPVREWAIRAAIGYGAFKLGQAAK